MILDNEVLFADGLAHGGTAAVIDLGGTRRGIGQPIRCFIDGVGLAGATGFKVVDGTTSSPATDRMTIVAAAAALNAGPIEFYLPDNTQQYVTVALTGTTSAGTWSCGIVTGTQTAR